MGSEQQKTEAEQKSKQKLNTKVGIKMIIQSG